MSHLTAELRPLMPGPFELRTWGAVPAWQEAVRAALPPRRLRQILTTVADQGLVSVGTLLLNVLLARHAPQTEYGVFVLAYSARRRAISCGDVASRKSTLESE